MNQNFTVVNYHCDACGKILVGYDKAIMKNENYISFKGNLNLQLWDPVQQKRYYIYTIPKDKALVTVCNLVCLETYMDIQKAAYLKKRDQWLRDEAVTDRLEKRVHPVHSFQPRYMKGKFDHKRY